MEYGAGDAMEFLRATKRESYKWWNCLSGKATNTVLIYLESKGYDTDRDFDLDAYELFKDKFPLTENLYITDDEIKSAINMLDD